MEANEAVVATLAVAQALERLGVAYVVAGSLASSFHGVPRSTLDSDLRLQRGRLDDEYMRETARALGVEDLLDQALDEA